MLALFGYMIFLIVYKWCVDWAAGQPHSPPSLIDTMINIALHPGSVTDPMLGETTQGKVQIVVLIVVVVCIPWMLVPKVMDHLNSR